MRFIVLLTLLPLLSCGTTTNTKSDESKVRLKMIIDALEMHKIKKGSYPTHKEGLEALVNRGFVKSFPVDAWGEPFHYHFPGEQRAFDLWSYGRDKKKGGEGPDADIGNW